MFDCRFLWVVIVTSAALLFTMLLVNKIYYLNSNPKGVNVEVKYNDSLAFPAVTICNSNKYRLVPTKFIL